MKLELENRDDALLVRFSRPPVNAFNLALVEELLQHMERLHADPPPGGLIFTGAGTLFSAGVDFKEAPHYDAAAQACMVESINRCLTLIYGFPRPTAAAINGSAMGGAFVLALACDIRVAARGEARLALSEVTAGIPYPACAMQIVNSELPPDLRRTLVLGGIPVDMQFAHDRGIVDELLDRESLLGRACELTRQRAALPAHARIKEQLRADALARMREIVAARRDPLLGGWIESAG